MNYDISNYDINDVIRFTVSCASTTNDTKSFLKPMYFNNWKIVAINLFKNNQDCHFLIHKEINQINHCYIMEYDYIFAKLCLVMDLFPVKDSILTKNENDDMCNFLVSDITQLGSFGKFILQNIDVITIVNSENYICGNHLKSQPHAKNVIRIDYGV